MSKTQFSPLSSYVPHLRYRDHSVDHKVLLEAVKEAGSYTTVLSKDAVESGMTEV